MSCLMYGRYEGVHTRSRWLSWLSFVVVSSAAMVKGVGLVGRATVIQARGVKYYGEAGSSFDSLE